MHRAVFSLSHGVWPACVGYRSASGGANWGPHQELASLKRSRHAVLADVTHENAMCGPKWAADDVRTASHARRLS
jgi:hypothetical protein